MHVAAGLADQLGGALRRCPTGVQLAVVVQLDDLALGHVLGAQLRRLHHQHRADREVRRDEAAGRGRRPRSLHRLAQLVEVEAGRADDALTPASRHCVAFPSAVSGVEKSTTTSASPRTSASAVSSAGSARPLSSSPSAASTASQTVAPMRPAAPETATLMEAAMGGG